MVEGHSFLPHRPRQTVEHVVQADGVEGGSVQLEWFEDAAANHPRLVAPKTAGEHFFPA